MATMVLAVILGWWLVAASRVELLPRPSLSLHPSHGVSLGDSVILRCHLPQLAAWVRLYQEGRWTYTNYKYKEQDTAEFSILNTNREHAGTYWCQYRVPWSAEESEKSDPVELVLTDHSFPPPSISLSSEECVETGTNVTIQCWNKDYGADFLLHKDGSSAPLQRQDPDVVGTATFTIFGVTPADSGTYRCSCRPWAYPFLSSPLGNNVTLEVTPTPAPPRAEEQSRANLVLALVRGVVAALIFGLAVFFIIDARSLWIQRDENCVADTGAPLNAEAVRFQVPPSDSECLTYAEIHAVTPGPQPPSAAATPQPPIIYTHVDTGGPLLIPPHPQCIMFKEL